MTAPIRFHVSAPNPHNHLFHVTMQVDGLADHAEIDLAMPAWTPGSYLLREYVRHVQRLVARDADGKLVGARKVDKATWRVDCRHTHSISLSYEVFSHELAVRTNHLDDSHGFYNPPALFLYARDYLDAEIEVRIEPPEGWHIYCGLQALGPARRVFRAQGFDELFDCPVEMGPMTPVTFEVLGVEHRYVIWGKPHNADIERLIADTTAIVEANASIFGDELPYDDFTFIVHLSDKGFGGLEHRNSTVLLYSATGFADRGVPGKDAPDPDAAYLDFLRLVAHEHFHCWNVKRMRPQALHTIDYQRENYSRELWSVEGMTSYYELRCLLEAGVIDAKRFLKLYAETIRKLDQVPGRLVHSLEEASFDAWIKLYRPDENTPNSSVSYYLKGELAALILDLQVRESSGGELSLDDVLRHIWEATYVVDDSGYPEGYYAQAVEEVLGRELPEFFRQVIRGRSALDWETEFDRVGLQLKREHKHGAAQASLGCVTGIREGRLMVLFVPTGSVAEQAGVYVGDELVAIDGRRIEPGSVDVQVKKRRPGQVVDLHLFRRGRLLMRRLELGEVPADAYSIVLQEEPEEEQLRLLEGWLGSRLEDDHDPEAKTPQGESA